VNQFFRKIISILISRFININEGKTATTHGTRCVMKVEEYNHWKNALELFWCDCVSTDLCVGNAAELY